MHALLLLLPFLAHAAIDPVVDAADRRLPESAALSAASISKMPKRRVLAARAFGQIMSPAGIAPLTRLAGDPMPFVREEALFALGQLGWVKEAASGHEDAIRSELLKHLSDKRISVRVAAAEALGKIGGEKAFELLTPAFYSGDSLLRAAAVTAFFRSRMILKLRDPTHPPASLSDGERSRLLALASSKNAPERAAVAYFFSRNAEPLAEETMARLARDPDATVRLFAVTALGKMKAQNSRASLEAALKDPEYSVRVAGVNAWSTGTSLGDQTRALMADKSFHVRAAAAATLGADQSDLLLLALEHDESNTVKAEALKALAKTKGEKLLPFLEEQLKSPLWQIREAAAQASEPLSPDAKEKFLSAALLKETDRLVRAALLEPYLALPGSSPFAQLKRSLDSSELSERATAVGALAARKEDEIAELAWKTYGASLEPKWVETREDLLDAIAKNTGETTTGYLQKVLQSDPDRGVRAKARALLTARGVINLPVYPDPDFTLSPFREVTFRKNPQVEIETNRGSFLVECFAAEAPIHVADFIGHVKAGFYDGLSWHRVISNFVVQGGDPDGTGFGGAGYTLRAEINRHPFARGALGMPRSQGFDTGGGQLFFSLEPTPHLEGQYTVFGQVIRGAEVLDHLERGDRILHARLK